MQASFQGLTQSAINKGYQLVLCGYRIGGAKAQHQTLLLHQHFCDDTCKQIRCITFGQPKVATDHYLQVEPLQHCKTLAAAGTTTACPLCRSAHRKRWEAELHAHCNCALSAADMEQHQKAFASIQGSCPIFVSWAVWAWKFMWSNISWDGARDHSVWEVVASVTAMRC